MNILYRYQKHIAKALLMFIFAFCISACDSRKTAVDLLKQAEALVDNNDAEAIKLLDSIHKPESLDRNDYMTYILLEARAKLNTNQPYPNDSLLLEAQKYFDQQDDLQKGMLAHIYLGKFYRTKSDNQNAMKQFLQSEHLSVKNKNDLITAKNGHFIGNLYFEKNEMDSAITRYQSAMSYYNKVDKTDKYKLQVITSIGRSYRVLENLDSAYHYFDKGYKLAQNINDQTYQGLEKNNLGYILFRKKEYAQGAEYLHQSLTYPISTEDSIAVYLNLSELYNQINQLDSSLHYTDKVSGKLSSIKDDYILAKAYRLLYEYHSNISNDKEALKYSRLECKVREQIEKENSAVQLVTAEKKYRQHLHQQEEEKQDMRNSFIIALLITVIVILLLIGYSKNKSNNQKRKLIEQQNRLLETNNKLLDSEKQVLEIDKELLQERVDVYLFIQNIYEDIFNEWTKLEKEIRIATENLYDKDLMVFGKVRLWLNNLSSVANVRFIFAAKDFLRREHNGEELLKVLSDEDLLLFMLLYNEYSDDEIEAIMGDFLREKDLSSRKQELVNQLYKANFDSVLINKFDKKK